MPKKGCVKKCAKYLTHKMTKNPMS